GADRLPVGRGGIVEELVDVGVNRLDGVVADAEVKDARARNRHLGDELGARLEELEVLQHRVGGGPAELAGDGDALGLGLHAVKLDALVELDELAALEPGEEVEMPPRA